MAQPENSAFVMRSGGFGDFSAFKTKGSLGPEAHLGPPPPETELDLVSAWVSGEPWNPTGYGIRFKHGRGLSEQEMMDLEVTYADSAATVRRNMEFPALPADPEAAEAFKVMSPLLKPGPDDRETPKVEDLVKGFAASLGEVIRTYAPKHAAAIATSGGEFVPGPKLGPALRAFAGLMDRTLDLNGDAPELPAAEGVGAYFISPIQSIDLRTIFDRAAFRTLMMGETVPRALGVAAFEARHALDERLSASRLPAQESWDAMLKEPGEYFLSPDRDLVGRLGAEMAASRKPARPVAAPVVEPVHAPEAPPEDLWGDNGPDLLDDEDPASFGL